ncbi:MAG TPA: hypothetical protein DCY59_11230 [Micrococcaceae bacterium]|nr:hypothetical protein [Micrococcaceae bacterium]
MSAQPALFGERLADLPGMVRGIVGVRVDERGKNLYTLQCENCLATEEPKILVLMTFKFHTRHQGDNPRLCRPCRVEAYSAGCTCDGCKEDRGRSLYA